MSEISLRGGCLCGSVRYEISGGAGRFWHCHCSRCRKSSGAGHASNVLLKPDSVEWTAGKELLRVYKMPDAKRFAVVFCSQCGSPLPRVAPDMSIAVVPAGTLDNDPGLRPEARIFQGSRATWSCDDSEIPGYDTYPG